MFTSYYSCTEKCHTNILTPFHLHIGELDEADILLPSRVSRTNSSYKSGGTKDFHGQMAITVGVQLKGKMDISLCPLYYNRLDGNGILRAELLCQLVSNSCFRKYLHRFGHDSSPTCPNCVDVGEDIEYILTSCGETSLGPNRVMEEVLNSRIL